MQKFLGVFAFIGNAPPLISVDVPKEIRERPAPSFRPVTLTATEKERDDMRELLRGKYGWAGEKLILVHPGSSVTQKPGKRKENPRKWPLANWRETISGAGKLASEAMFILTGTANERGITEEILAGAAVKAVSLAGEISLRRLFALQSMAHSCITVDTGVAHTATAVGCPALILYGINDPRSMGTCSPKGWGPTITVRGFRDLAELGGDKYANPIENIRPETVVRLWRELPPRPDAPPSECLVTHYYEGNMTGETLPIQYY